ncbi:PP2C family protein-serine/threonine phosphatase [Klenkia brasiliensis]|uniref:Serine phosphatase RsbU, regulator of sigma subunit n=1 Tax=Klenkia brasiliensis TaxID=333142 RepID=A0A1G7XSS7_9ACTN|nr:GAF domain-containing SpoIIE family protein phosphatase [Klenkia brasiliensis]SDG87285.1 Serine phosphatase RsbU, regulator of sigma subunit [Klenkia brasiliensis]
MPAEGQADVRLDALLTVVLELGRATTLRELAGSVLVRGMGVLGAAGGALAVRDPADDSALRLVLTDGLGGLREETHGALPLDEDWPAVVAARTGTRVVLHDAAEAVAQHPGMAEVVAASGCPAWAVLPLEAGDRVLGSLSVGWSRPQRFDPADLAVVEAFAAQCAQALDRLLTRQAEQRALRALADTVAALQRSLLSAPPSQEGLQVAVRYRPAARQAQVGGDWYDGFRLADGRTVLVIGDVTGHDSSAAAAMASVRNVLRGVAHAGGGSPAAMAAGLDRALRDLPVATLATAVLAVVEPHPDGALLRWTCAGHPPPLLAVPGCPPVVLDRPADLLLGVDPDRPRSDHEVLLPPGSTVLLHTDGLVERRDAPLDVGTAALLARLAQLRDLPLEELADRLLGPPGAADDECDRDDDVALLALRTRDGAATPHRPPARWPG